METNKTMPYDGDLNRIGLIIKHYREMAADARTSMLQTLSLNSGGAFTEAGNRDIVNNAASPYVSQMNYWQNIYDIVAKAELDRVGYGSIVEGAVASKLVPIIPMAPAGAVLNKKENVKTTAKKAKPEETKTDSKADEKAKETPAERALRLSNSSKSKGKKEDTKTTTEKPADKKVENAPTKTEDVVKTTPAAAEEATDVETLETKRAELTTAMEAVVFEDDVKDFITKHYNSKKIGKPIEGEVTAEDEADVFIVIEESGPTDAKVKTKRELHGKEEAYNAFETHLKQNGVDLTYLNPRMRRDFVGNMVRTHSKEMARKEAERAAELYKALKLTVDRTSVKGAFAGKELIKLVTGIIKAENFDENVLTGTKDQSEILSEDNIKIKAIRLAASGEFEDAARAVKTVFTAQEKEITLDNARRFVTDLMNAGHAPYLELENAIVNMLQYYQETEKDYTKGLEAATKFIREYSKVQTKSADGTFNTVKQGKKDVPVFAYWKQERIEKFISKCIGTAMELGHIPKPTETADSSKEESVEKPSKESASKKDDNKSDKKKETETAAANTANTATKVPDATENTETEAATGNPEVSINVKANNQKTKFECTLENTSFAFHFVPRAGKSMENAVKTHLVKYLDGIAKNNEKALKNSKVVKREFPAGFENYKKNMPFTIKLVATLEEKKAA